MFRTPYHVTCISSGKQMPHAVGYLPFLEFWRLFSNCCTRKLLRPLSGWGGFYTPVNNGDKAKKVPIAFGDGWKRVNTNAKNNDTSLADAVKTPIYWEKFRPVDKKGVGVWATLWSKMRAVSVRWNMVNCCNARKEIALNGNVNAAWRE